MSNTCQVAGCRRTATLRSTRMCRKHITHNRRWGHPEQRPITKGELARWKAHVRGLINKRANREKVWTSVLALLEACRTSALGEVRDYENGKLAHRTSLTVQRVIVDVTNEAAAEDIVLAMLSFGYMGELEWSRFRSDNAFFAAMGRRFYLMGRSNYAGHFNATTGKRHLTARELSPKAVLLLGRTMSAAFAALGMKLRMAEVEAERRLIETKAAPMRALDEEEQQP